jgi:hypothetical protein
MARQSCWQHEEGLLTDVLIGLRRLHQRARQDMTEPIILRQLVAYRTVQGSMAGEILAMKRETAAVMEPSLLGDVSCRWRQRQ